MGLRLLSRRLRRNRNDIVGVGILEQSAPVKMEKEIVRSAAASDVVSASAKAVSMSDCPGFGIFCVFCDVCTFARRTNT